MRKESDDMISSIYPIKKASDRMERAGFARRTLPRQKPPVRPWETTGMTRGFYDLFLIIRRAATDRLGFYELRDCVNPTDPTRCALCKWYIMCWSEAGTFSRLWLSPVPAWETAFPLRSSLPWLLRFTTLRGIHEIKDSWRWRRKYNFYIYKISDIKLYSSDLLLEANENRNYTSSKR